MLAGVAFVGAGAYWMRTDQRNAPDRGASLPAAAPVTSRIGDGSSGGSTADRSIAGDIGRSPPADVTGALTGRSIHAALPVYGKVEARFLTGGMLNANATRVLNSRSFDNVAADLRHEGESENPDRQTAYRIQLEDSLVPYAHVGQLSRFECGKNVCMGSIGTVDARWGGEWMRGLREQATLPMPALSWRVLTLSPSTQEIRFLFTTAPESSGFTSVLR